MSTLRVIGVVCPLELVPARAPAFEVHALRASSYDCRAMRSWRELWLGLDAVCMLVLYQAFVRHSFL